MRERCNKCGGAFVDDYSQIVATLRCEDCGRHVPRGAMRVEEHEQIQILPAENPDEVVARAKAENNPVATVCLFSGGNDSTVLAHRCRDHYESLVFIDTGTAVPGVREFVESFAVWVGKPLKVYEAGDEFRRMVTGEGENKSAADWKPLGFPGPGQQGRAYNRLKERQLEQLRRDLKAGHPRSARCLYLTGVRRDESQRRKSRPALSRKGGMAFCNPLIDWTNSAMRRYRQEHEIPQSDVAALIHRSGECNCGAFAAPGEREMMEALWPAWFEATIGSLEREAVAAGIPRCVWGAKDASGDPIGDAGELCTDCQIRLDVSA